jgi:hypothetical protein
MFFLKSPHHKEIKASQLTAQHGNTRRIPINPHLFKYIGAPRGMINVQYIQDRLEAAKTVQPARARYGWGLFIQAPRFITQAALETRIGDTVFRFRTEEDVWPVFFVHVLLQGADLISGRSGWRWRLTPSGEKFLNVAPVIQDGPCLPPGGSID